MTFLLRLKHWQLFLLMFGAPLLILISVIVLVVITDNQRLLFISFPILMFLFIALVLSWLYTVGTNLHKMLPEDVTMSLVRFKVFFFIPAIYLLTLALLLLSITSGLASALKMNYTVLMIIPPLHLMSMSCLIYCNYFVAKALKSVEWKQEVPFSSFTGEFFLLLFFAIGIWILQPTINKLFDRTTGKDKNPVPDYNGLPEEG